MQAAKTNCCCKSMVKKHLISLFEEKSAEGLLEAVQTYGNMNVVKVFVLIFVKLVVMKRIL